MSAHKEDLPHSRLVEFAYGSENATPAEVQSMARECMRLRTQVEMLKMDIEALERRLCDVRR